MVNGRAGALRKGRCLTVASAENCPLMGGRDVRDQAYQRVEDSGYTVWEGHGTQIERPEEVQNYGTHMIAKYSAEQQVRRSTVTLVEARSDVHRPSAGLG